MTGLLTSQLQVRADTAANWTAANPVLKDGEIAQESDTLFHKIGDGITAWNSLIYYHGPPWLQGLDGGAPSTTYVAGPNGAYHGTMSHEWIAPSRSVALPNAVYSGNSKGSQLSDTFSGYIRPDTGLTTFMTRTGLVTNTHAMSVAWDLDGTAQSGQRNMQNDGKLGTDATFALGGGVHQGRKIYFCLNESPAPTSDYNISQFNGTSAWNMSTFPTSNPSLEFDASPTVEGAVGIALSDDGTKFYIADEDTTRVTQWTASTAYDIDTLTYDSVFFDYSNEDSTNQGISFNVDGTSFYMVSDSSVIYQYDLVTEWDLSTCSYSGLSFDASSTIATARNVYVKPDETSIYVMGTSVNSLYQFNM